MARIANEAELARRLEDALEQQRAISGVLRAAARSTELQPVLDAVLEACERLCRAEYAALYLLEQGLLHAAAFDIGAEGVEYEGQHPHALDRTTAAGRAGLLRETVHIPDIRSDPEYTYSGPTEYYRAVIGVPILLEDELLGVVVLSRREPEPYTEEHIALVQTFADQAALAIANARLLEAVERQRTELSRFIAPQVAELVSSSEGERLLAGHRAYISCLFCDLRGFTSFAETAAPEELFEVLREYHDALGELMPEYEATLEHFAGDGVMIFFNDPVEVASHELEAVRFALAAQERLARLAEGWRRRGTTLALGVGIESGYATLGRIGFEGRYDYAAIGPVANLASRLGTHAAPGQILIGQRLYSAVEEAVEAAPVGNLELKGIARPVPAYEVRALRG